MAAGAAGPAAPPAALAELVGLFSACPDPTARYQQLLQMAQKLEALPAAEQVAENKVEGCVSQVWVVAELDRAGLLQYRADSDSQLTKGLAALLVRGLSGAEPREVLSLSPGFIDELGLRQSLTPSRNNGFLNMFLKMQKIALELVMAQEAGAQEGFGEPAAEPVEDEEPGTTERMREALQEGLAPAELVIHDDSKQHRGHYDARAGQGKKGRTAESHFRLEIVSESFQGQNTVKRHRSVYALLQPLMEPRGTIHALSLKTLTPQEAAQN